MSKVRPWLGLYLWMNEERQSELGELMNSKELQIQKQSFLRVKLSKSARVVNMPSTKSLKAK